MALAELYGTGLDGPERFREAVRKVTREDVMRVVGKYMSHPLVTVTGPEEVRPIFEAMR